MKRFLLHLLLLLLSGLHNANATDSATETAGDILSVVIPSIAYGTTWYKDDHPGRTQFYQSFFTNTVTAFGLKLAIDKERPDSSNNNSFPSAHTAYAMQGASFVHLRYGWQYAAPLYLGAAYVGYSRVHSEKHYNSDVLAGAGIGFLSSYFFTTPYKGVTITPVTSSGFYEITLQKSW